MPLIHTAANWDEAFAKARELLAKDELTHVFACPKSSYGKFSHVAIRLAEFGPPKSTLVTVEALYRRQQHGATNIELWHSELDYIAPNRRRPMKGWLLAFVHPDQP